MTKEKSSFHDHFEVSVATATKAAALHDIGAEWPGLESLKAVFSDTVKDLLVRWCIMQSYLHETVEIKMEDGQGFNTLLARHAGFEPGEFRDVTRSVIDDLVAWLRAGNTVDGSWGRLELQPTGTIMVMTAEPTRIVMEGFVPAQGD